MAGPRRGCRAGVGMPGGGILQADPRNSRRAGALTGGVIQVQGHLLAAHGHAGRVLLEHGWSVVLSKKGSGWFLRAAAGARDPPEFSFHFDPIRFSPHIPLGSGIPPGAPWGDGCLWAQDAGEPKSRLRSQV